MPSCSSGTLAVSWSLLDLRDRRCMGKSRRGRCAGDRWGRRWYRARVSSGLAFVGRQGAGHAVAFQPRELLGWLVELQVLVSTSTSSWLFSRLTSWDWPSCRGRPAVRWRRAAAGAARTCLLAVVARPGSPTSLRASVLSGGAFVNTRLSLFAPFRHLIYGPATYRSRSPQRHHTGDGGARSALALLGLHAWACTPS